MGREIIISGGDAQFFPFLIAAVTSLRSHSPLAAKDFGIIDQGLEPGQRCRLEALGCRIVVPEWTLPVPEEKRLLRNIGLVARTALRDYFPGYGIYLWFDADAWAQTADFASEFTAAARASGAAVALENGPGYRRTLVDLKWWVGNMIAAFGPAGARLSFRRSVNIGVLCLKDTAPHWQAWIRAYSQALEKTGKVNLDQHAFLAAAYRESLPTAFLPSRCNWLPHLSCPVWNPDTRMLCEPVAPYRPLSVLHLAGPQKTRRYRLPQLGGGFLETSLTYPAMRQHAEESGDALPAAAGA